MHACAAVEQERERIGAAGLSRELQGGEAEAEPVDLAAEIARLPERGQVAYSRCLVECRSARRAQPQPVTQVRPAAAGGGTRQCRSVEEEPERRCRPIPLQPPTTSRLDGCRCLRFRRLCACCAQATACGLPSSVEESRERSDTEPGPQ